jgi:hypothetical protein
MAQPASDAESLRDGPLPMRPEAMRNDLTSMLLPFFPEEQTGRVFRAVIDGRAVTIYSENPAVPVATPGDRRVLNYLAATLAAAIRAGGQPTRHLNVELRGLLEAMASDAALGAGLGGSDYGRVTARLDRLMATVIETEMPLGEDVARRRRFRWIDAYQHDDLLTAGGRRILRLSISLSEDAFSWLTRSLGFDVTPREFQALTSGRASLWRIFEICLARLIQSGGAEVRIGLAELRDRVPIASELKVFKARTLKAAMEGIAAQPEMARRLRLSLDVATDAGFEPLEPGRRAALERIHVRVTRGSAPLPDAAPLIGREVAVS